MLSQLAIFSNEVIQLCCLVRNLVQHCISQNYIFYCVPHRQPVILYYLHTPHNKDCTCGKKLLCCLQQGYTRDEFITYENGKMHSWIKHPFKCSDRELPGHDRLAFISACRNTLATFLLAVSKQLAFMHGHQRKVLCRLVCTDS